MINGTVSKLVMSFGSNWGRIRPRGELREIFFNSSSLMHPAEFAGLVEGQLVDFEEENDRTNGTHAVKIRNHI
jgi:cold shock CspA family protein